MKCGKLKPITNLVDYRTSWGNHCEPPEYDSICKSCLKKEIKFEKQFEKEMLQKFGNKGA